MGEAKIFESEGFVVTTERFVYGNKVVFLDDIQGGAMAFEHRSWGAVLIIGGVGLAAFLCGAAYTGFIVIIIGILTLVGAGFLLNWADRAVVMSLKSGEGIDIKVKNKELGTALANAINTGIRERHRLRNDALHNELSNLPSA
jgi:hypothetical protein